MKYNNPHKIRTIWNENEQNTIDLNRIIPTYNKNPADYNAKKIFRLETDWEEMEVPAHYNYYDEIDYYYGYLYNKKYEITIVNFPLKFLNYIDCCVLCKYTSIPGINLNLSSFSNKIIYIYDLDTTEEFYSAKKTIKIYVSNLLTGMNSLLVKYQVYSKLKLNIVNPQSYK